MKFEPVSSPRLARTASETRIVELILQLRVLKHALYQLPGAADF